MDPDKKCDVPASKDESQERREFLKRVGKTSVAVPAAALLIAASQEKAIANGISGACI
jgi:hypothetical protein